MTKELTAYMIEKVTALMEAPTCCAEAKAVCREWLDAVGSEAGEKVFGAEMAKNVLAHAEEIKKNGAKFCDCPACTACAAIIAKKVEL